MPRRKLPPQPQLTAAEIRMRSLTASAHLAGMCTHAAPCGGVCVLNPDVYHTLHCCNDRDCAACHGYARFGRTYK